MESTTLGAAAGLAIDAVLIATSSKKRKEFAKEMAVAAAEGAADLAKDVYDTLGGWLGRRRLMEGGAKASADFMFNYTRVAFSAMGTEDVLADGLQWYVAVLQQVQHAQTVVRKRKAVSSVLMTAAVLSARGAVTAYSEEHGLASPLDVLREPGEWAAFLESAVGDESHGCLDLCTGVSDEPPECIAAMDESVGGWAKDVGKQQMQAIVGASELKASDGVQSASCVDMIEGLAADAPALASCFASCADKGSTSADCQNDCSSKYLGAIVGIGGLSGVELSDLISASFDIQTRCIGHKGFIDLPGASETEESSSPVCPPITAARRRAGAVSTPQAISPPPPHAMQPPIVAQRQRVLQDEVGEASFPRTMFMVFRELIASAKGLLESVAASARAFFGQPTPPLTPTTTPTTTMMPPPVVAQIQRMMEDEDGSTLRGAQQYRMMEADEDVSGGSFPGSMIMVLNGLIFGNTQLEVEFTSMDDGNVRSGMVVTVSRGGAQILIPPSLEAPVSLNMTVTGDGGAWTFSRLVDVEPLPASIADLVLTDDTDGEICGEALGDVIEKYEDVKSYHGGADKITASLWESNLTLAELVMVMQLYNSTRQAAAVRMDSLAMLSARFMLEPDSCTRYGRSLRQVRLLSELQSGENETARTSLVEAISMTALEETFSIEHTPPPPPPQLFESGFVMKTPSLLKVGSTVALSRKVGSDHVDVHLPLHIEVMLTPIGPNDKIMRLRAEPGSNFGPALIWQNTEATEAEQRDGTAASKTSSQIALVKPRGFTQLQMVGGVLGGSTTGGTAPCWAGALGESIAPTTASTSVAFDVSSGSALIIFEDEEGGEQMFLRIDDTSVRVQGGGLVVNNTDIRAQC